MYIQTSGLDPTMGLMVQDHSLLTNIHTLFGYRNNVIGPGKRIIKPLLEIIIDRLIIQINFFSLLFRKELSFVTQSYVQLSTATTLYLNQANAAPRVQRKEVSKSTDYPRN